MHLRPISMFLLLSIPALAQTPVWQPAAVLEARSGQGAAFDSVRGTIVMFGGFQTARYDETWEWDSVSWTLRRPNTRPPGRRDQSVAFDRNRGRLVMFGGNGVAGGLSDTWEWDGSDWTQRLPTTSPSARDGSAMAYDATRGDVILFGGQSPLQSDTWRWNGTNWTQAAPNTNPGAHALGAMAFDAVRQRLVMFGGSTSVGNSNDTWEWDGTDWQQALPVNRPPVRQRHSLTFDSQRGVVLLFGGSAGTTRYQDVWQYDGVDWTAVPVPAVAPTVRDRTALVYDERHHETIVFGGRGPTNSVNLADTWQWNGSAWTLLAATQQPSPRANPVLAYDAADQAILLFGGASASGAQQDTWRWDGANWQAQASAVSPPARSRAAMCYDSQRQRTVLFGGLDASGTDLADTWEWNGSNWAATSPTIIPPQRSGHALAFDATRGRSVMFGGRFGAANIDLNDTWEWDGSNWTAPTTAVSPAIRSDHALAFDRVRGRTVLFGGISQQPAATLGDVWEWDGTQWLQIFPANAPIARSRASLGFDVARGRCVLFGGVDANAVLLADSWDWDGVTWTPAASTGPSARADAGMAYDSLRRRHVLQGGRVGPGLALNGETWELAPNGTADAVPFGNGCGGSLGEPMVSPTSPPSLGNPVFAVRETNLVPNSVGFLAIGFGRERMELGAGCRLYLSSPLGIIAMLADANGAASYPMPLPNASWLLGVRAFVQGAGIDPQGPYLGQFTLTRGLDLLLGL